MLSASLIFSPSSVSSICSYYVRPVSIHTARAPFLNIGYPPRVDFPRFGLMISAIVAYELLLERLMHAMKINKDNGYLLYSRSFMAAVKTWLYNHVSPRTN